MVGALPRYLHYGDRSSNIPELGSNITVSVRKINESLSSNPPEICFWCRPTLNLLLELTFQLTGQPQLYLGMRFCTSPSHIKPQVCKCLVLAHQSTSKAYLILIYQFLKAEWVWWCHIFKPHKLFVLSEPTWLPTHVHGGRQYTHVCVTHFWSMKPGNLHLIHAIGMIVAEKDHPPWF